MTLRSLLVPVILVAALSACRDLSLAAAPTPPALPDGAQELAPLATYAQWWQDTEDCAALRGDMSRVTWFVVPNRTSFRYQDASYDGYWWNGVHWILLAGEKVTNAMLVRHEMLHELLGRGDHPPEYFQGKCAAVVLCLELCREGN